MLWGQGSNASSSIKKEIFEMEERRGQSLLHTFQVVVALQAGVPVVHYLIPAPRLYTDSSLRQDVPTLGVLPWPGEFSYYNSQQLFSAPDVTAPLDSFACTPLPGSACPFSFTQILTDSCHAMVDAFFPLGRYMARACT